MPLIRRNRPLKNALANAEAAAISARSAAAKADKAMDKADELIAAAMEVVIQAGKEMDERLDEFDAIMDDPKERGKFIWETIQGTFQAAREDKSDESLNVFDVIMKMFRS
jgi:hypothetical protein